MPLTTYIAGEVLTAASLNANFTFAADNPPGGLELITTTTIGSAVSTVTVTGAFSATYDNYLVNIVGGVGSQNQAVRLSLGATTTGYYYAINQLTFAGSSSVNSAQIATHWFVGEGTTTGLTANIGIQNPFATKRTFFTTSFSNTQTSGGTSFVGGGFLDNTTSYTAFTIVPNAGTFTGGIIRVYGYKN